MRIEPTTMKYGTHSRDYLRRARQRLDEGCRDSLFYAAFEIRAGVEARMQQYLQAQEDASRKKKRGWKIAVLGAELERMFRIGDKVVEVAVLDAADIPEVVLYYTPVKNALRKTAQQLGDYLHAGRFHELDDPWWTQLRALLEGACSELERANLGVLVGPPLLNPRTATMSMQREVLPHEDPETARNAIGSVGKRGRLRIRYLDSVPAP
jgi:hypothetical protein